jgi:hypothetical protein
MCDRVPLAEATVILVRFAPLSVVEVITNIFTVTVPAKYPYAKSFLLLHPLAK